MCGIWNPWCVYDMGISCTALFNYLSHEVSNLYCLHYELQIVHLKLVTYLYNFFLRNFGWLPSESKHFNFYSELAYFHRQMTTWLRNYRKPQCPCQSFRLTSTQKFWKIESAVTFNPRLTKLFFVTRLTKGGCYNPLPRFSKPNPLWNWFWYQ